MLLLLYSGVGLFLFVSVGVTCCSACFALLCLASPYLALPCLAPAFPCLAFPLPCLAPCLALPLLCLCLYCSALLWGNFCFWFLFSTLSLSRSKNAFRLTWKCSCNTRRGRSSVPSCSLRERGRASGASGPDSVQRYDPRYEFGNEFGNVLFFFNVVSSFYFICSLKRKLSPAILVAVNDRLLCGFQSVAVLFPNRCSSISARLPIGCCLVPWVVTRLPLRERQLTTGYLSARSVRPVTPPLPIGYISVSAWFLLDPFDSFGSVSVPSGAVRSVTDMDSVDA